MNKKPALNDIIDEALKEKSRALFIEDILQHLVATRFPEGVELPLDKIKDCMAGGILIHINDAENRLTLVPVDAKEAAALAQRDASGMAS